MVVAALSVTPPRPSVSVFTPPMVMGAVAAGEKFRLRILKSAPSTVARLEGFALARLKKTSSVAPGTPAVPWLKSGEDDQFVPDGPPTVLHLLSLSPDQKKEAPWAEAPMASTVAQASGMEGLRRSDLGEIRARADAGWEGVFIRPGWGD